MSDSSDDEDLSRFREAVDNSFLTAFESKTGIAKEEPKPAKSERYLEEASHYNDIKVPEKMQKKIGAKVSELIEKSIEFVDVEYKVKKRKIKGGVKLFTSSEGFLSCEEPKDTYTEAHNVAAKKLKSKKGTDSDEEDKIKSVAVSPEYVMSKEETKCWKSRRKEKIFKYKKKDKNSKILLSVE